MTAARLTVDSLRRAVAARVEASSLRAVADEIGLSHNGLNNFLAGRNPQKRTVALLVDWFYQRSAHANAPSRADVEVALAQIKSYVRDQSKPRAVRDRRRDEIIDELKE